MTYNKKQSRFAHAFVHSSTLCSILCQGDDCGRVHFVSGHRHGDYEEGELDQLLLDAKRSPDLYVEESEYDHIDIAYIQGKQIVPDCVCGHAERVATFIEDHFKEIARYISECMKDRERDRKQEAKDDVDAFKAVELALRGTQ